MCYLMSYGWWYPSYTGPSHIEALAQNLLLLHTTTHTITPDTVAVLYCCCRGSILLLSHRYTAAVALLYYCRRGSILLLSRFNTVVVALLYCCCRVVILQLPTRYHIAAVAPLYCCACVLIYSACVSWHDMARHGMTRHVLILDGVGGVSFN